ncbi:MAG: hypothetical protein ACYC63_00125 [Armatimonadota bacterium]
MKAGMAVTTITPERPTWMTGFASRTAPSEGAYNDLEAAAIVFESGNTRVGILSLDLVGVDEYLLEAIRTSASELGIPPSQMLVNCSHTHCAPACRRVRGSCRKFDYEYLEGLKAKLAELLAQAAADLRVARMDYTVGSCTLGINRRRRNADGSYESMLPDPAKPTDTDVPVLRVLSPEGDTRAVLFSYACHPTTMGGQLLGTDFPGPARDVLREKIPGCVPIFLQGCGGDVKPRNLSGQRTFASGPVEMVYEIGHELGRAVLAALCGEPTALGEELAAVSEILPLPARAEATEDELATLEQGDDWQKKYAAAVRAIKAEGRSLASELPMEVQALRLGDLTIVGMGGEVSCEIGLDIKRQLSGQKIWTLGYSNLLRCYVASYDAHAEGGYEPERSFLYSLVPEPRPLGLKPESATVLAAAGVRLAAQVQQA